MNVALVRPGSESVAWLHAAISQAKGADPLSPVTVVVPSNHIGLALRRALARHGYANVRFGILGRVIEPFGAAAVAGRGRTPMTTASEEAWIREAVRRAGSAFGEVSEHPALIRNLRELFGELRAAEIDERQLEALAAWGRMARAAVDVYRTFRSLVSEAGLYDDADLVESATQTLTGSAAERLLGEGGVVIAYLPAGLTPAESRFITALAERCSLQIGLGWFSDELADTASAGIVAALAASTAAVDAAEARDVEIVAAPDAAEEVRSAVRHLLNRVEEGQQLGRVAIFYAEADPYGPMLRDTLDAAGVTWAGVDGRPLSESWAGRGLLGLLRLRERDFGRVEVLAWLGSLPEADPGGVSIGDWDRLSRDAAVVKGAKQWQDRLRRHATEARAEADGMEHDGRSEGAVRFRRREAGAMDRMAAFVDLIETRTRPPAESSWSAMTQWAEATRRRFLPSRDSWPDRERQADEMVGEQLLQLAAAGAVEAIAGTDRFVQACATALEGRRQAEGRLSTGVAVGPVGSLSGLDFDLVYVLGVTERALPRPDTPDPVFPPDGGPDPLGRADRRRSNLRRSFLTAVWSGHAVRLSFPAWDSDLRPSYPSPWLVELAKPLNGVPVTAAGLRLGRGGKNVEAISSPDAGIAKARALISVAEWRSAQARRLGASLPRSGLAARPELPLGRHLEARAARLSDAFTEFDGNVESQVDELDVLSRGLAAKAHSASGIEGWATCPFAYLLERVVGVEPTERPEQEVAWSIGAAAKGALIHEILNRFFLELAAAGRPKAGERYGPTDRVWIEQLAEEEFGRLELAGVTGHRLAWDNEKQAMLADLRTFLRKDEELRLQDELVPTFFEQGFGMPGDTWSELVLDLGSGRTARLRGRIDRIDLSQDAAAPNSARLIDYKTGSGSTYREADFAADPVVAGTKVQPSAYAAAIRARYPGIRVASGYWFISAKGNFRFLPVPDDELRLKQVLQVMDRGLRAGAFPQVPGDDSSRRDRTSWENCFYCAFDRVCPSGRDQMRERKRDRPGPLIHLELRAAADGS